MYRMIPLILKSLKIRSNVALAYSLYWSLRLGSRWNQLINTPKGCGSRDQDFFDDIFVLPAFVQYQSPHLQNLFHCFTSGQAGPL